jgi:hypothetical protein
MPEPRFALACSSAPRILGRCTFDGPAPLVTLDDWGKCVIFLKTCTLIKTVYRGRTTYTFMYYYRHSTSSMRFYSLGAGMSGHTGLAAAHPLALRDDFSRQQSPPLVASLNSSLINQVRCVHGFFTPCAE